MIADLSGHFAGIGLAGRRGERNLFASLDFTLAPGAALLLAGPNGSGKSSLLRLMAGFGRPLAGRFTWNGADIAGDVEAHRARLHYVGHLDGLKPALTVAETLEFWIKLAGRGQAGAEALVALGLAPIASLPCRFLSSGQRRRLALARLAAWPAPLWLLDEPAVGLDRDALSALGQLIAKHRRRGGIVILSTHQGIELEGADTLRLTDFPPAKPAFGASDPALDW